MNAGQIELVQASWRQVLPIADQAAALFYGRLFELDPSLKPMFRGDMKEQGRKLMSMIGFAVNALNRIENLLPGLRTLGERHGSYGVRDEHYDTVANALLWTLDKGLGAGFTTEVKEAWVTVYTVLADTMKAAAHAKERKAA